MTVGDSVRWGRGQALRSRTLLVLCVALGWAPSLAFADWTDFAPKPFENGAFVDDYTAFERDRLHSGPQASHWTDVFLREKLTLYSNGYSYDPRFLLYRFSIAPALRQEDYHSSSVDPGWTLETGLDYDTTVLLLPEHPYNLELYARRFEPLFKEQAATQHSNVENSRGVSFRYRQKPYFLHVAYLDDSIESGDSSSDVRRVSLDGEYFKRFAAGNEVSFSGGFNPSWFTNSQGLDGSSSEYLFSNFLNLQQVPWWAVPLRLTSNVTAENFDQQSATAGKLKNDQFVWYERLSAYLPLRFRGDLYYRYQENQSTLAGSTASNTSRDINFDLIHRLYESLDSTYRLLDDSRTSPGGSSTFFSNSLILNYNKAIPRGRVLAEVDAGTAETDNNGQTDVVNESHPAVSVPNVPGSVVLGQPNAEPGSIVVLLKSPLPPAGQLIQLVEDVDYRVMAVPNLSTFEIQVFNLPSQFVVPGTYDFVVSYTVSGNFKLRTNTYGSSASVELFDNFLTPYVSYSAIRSSVVSGVFPGGPVDSTTYTAGLIVRYGPLQMRGEYQDLQWDVSPYRAWTMEAQYVQALNETTSLYATGAYINKYYPNGTSNVYPGSSTVATAYTEETETASGSVQKELFDRDLYVSAGGSYTAVQGQFNSNSYSLNSSLVWRIGKVDLTLGVTAYATDTSGPATISSDRDHEFVYLNFRRRLF
jgi:hypothetical protein